MYIIIKYEIERFPYAPLAQLDRVAHYECEGWGFESLMAHQHTLGIPTIPRVFLFPFSRIKFLCPVVVYPKEKLMALAQLLKKADIDMENQKEFTSVEDMFADMGIDLDV